MVARGQREENKLQMQLTNKGPKHSFSLCLLLTWALVRQHGRKKKEKQTKETESCSRPCGCDKKKKGEGNHKRRGRAQISRSLRLQHPHFSPLRFVPSPPLPTSPSSTAVLPQHHFRKEAKRRNKHKRAPSSHQAPAYVSLLPSH
jgi:hypothetical protein